MKALNKIMRWVFGSSLMYGSLANALPLADFYAGAYQWRPNFSGEIQIQSSGVDDELDLKDDLGLSSANANVFMLGLEHPVVFLPDIQIRYTALKTDSSELVNKSFEYGGQTFSGSEVIETDSDLTHTDFSMYWGLPVPMARLNLGATIRHFSGSLELTGQTSSVNGSQDLNLFVPLAFARAEVDLPVIPLQLGAEVHGVLFGSSYLADVNLYANLVFTVALLDIGLTAGYRTFNIDLDAEDFGGEADDLSFKTRIQGLYAGVTLHI